MHAASQEGGDRTLTLCVTEATYGKKIQRAGASSPYHKEREEVTRCGSRPSPTPMLEMTIEPTRDPRSCGTRPVQPVPTGNSGWRVGMASAAR